MEFLPEGLHTLLHTHGLVRWIAINWRSSGGKREKINQFISTIHRKWKTNSSAMARDETDDVLPDKDVAKEFYAKYEPKEILGRYGRCFFFSAYCWIQLNFQLDYRGVSSTVRRCVEKETGREYACKIMDISGDPSENDGPKLKESTLREISVLRRVAGHPYISTIH